MPVAINFSKGKVAGFLEALASGQDIKCPDGKWTQADVLALAGVCFFAASSHGPVMHEGFDPEAVTAERLEAINEAFTADLWAAVGWCAEAAMLEQDGLYDGRFEPTHRALVWVGEGRQCVNPLGGFKGVG